MFKLLSSVQSISQEIETVYIPFLRYIYFEVYSPCCPDLAKIRHVYMAQYLRHRRMDSWHGIGERYPNAE